MTVKHKRTPLNAWHHDRNAKMADFGGYDMPLWYSSVRDEHLAVITAAGCFDTSHMTALTVTGKTAADLLQTCFTNNLDACLGPSKKPLEPGRCVYGAFLNEKGFVIDDAIVFFVAANNYMVVVNAGMGPAIANHLNKQLNGLDAQVTDLTDRLGKMDIQGPASAKILARVLADPDTVFQRMPYFSFKGHYGTDLPPADAVHLDDGTPILLSRTGYTGEFGFEIFIAPDKLETLWKRLLDAGEPHGVRPCGLAARDSLRVGAVLPLSHQDIGPWPFVNHPWPFALPYAWDGAGFTKEFVGGKALRDAVDAPFTHAFVGKDPRKVGAGKGSRVLDAAGREIGTVLTCATDMAIGILEDTIRGIADPDKPVGFKPGGLACGFVKVSEKLALNQQITIADSRRTLPVTIVDDIRPHRTARKAMATMR